MCTGVCVREVCVCVFFFQQQQLVLLSVPEFLGAIQTL